LEHNSYKIAVIDDSKLIRERLIEKIKSIKGFDIIWDAKNLSESYNLIKTTLPDILILDIQLPDGNGMEFLHYVRKHYKNVIVIMLTNNVCSVFKKICERIGSNFFFDKTKEFDKIFLFLKSLNKNESQKNC